MEVMVDDLFIPMWVLYTIGYFIMGIFWATLSVHNDWTVEADFNDIPLWPFYIFFWLPMIVFMVIGLFIWGFAVVLLKEQIFPKIRHKYYQFRYRREVNKFKPKYGYDK
ncbi:hypothetical protein LCGC14_0856950 [marine sediment metagenome]|uniref:Uncharacterized protein n=1 Tax=marine sediment metagenome TaxID=412755 RepID=A0A0F9PDF7_9ZZZZ